MKYLLTILISIGILSCKTQDKVVMEATIGPVTEPGKCYVSVCINDSSYIERKEKAFVMEIVEPKYKAIKKKYSIKNLEQYESQKEYFRVPTREAHFKFLLKNEELSAITSLPKPRGIVYCLAEVPAEYKTIYKKDIKAGKVSIVQHKITVPSRIIKTYVHKKPKEFKANQYFFEAAIWTETREALYGARCPRVPIIKDIQEKLIALGYSLEINDQVDEKTKKALFDFQEKNNLKVGQLDADTLKKLEIRY